MLQMIFTFFLVLQLWTASLAQAEGQCELVFLKRDLIHEIQKINDENNNFIKSVLPDKENFVLDYSVEQKRFFHKLINNFRYRFGLKYDYKLKLLEITEGNVLGSMTDPREIEYLASELSLALFGPRHLIRDYLFKSHDERFREATLARIGENLLRKGLMRTWSSMTHKDPNFWARFKLRLRKFQKHGLVEFLTQLPFPKINDKVISDDLMSKVILEGFDNHKLELEQALKTQGARDTYNTFRKVALVAFFASIIGSHTMEAREQQRLEMQHSQAVAVKQLKNLNELPRQIEDDANSSKREIFKIVFAKAKRDFIEKWGENPTPEEEQVLYGETVVSTFLTSK